MLWDEMDLGLCLTDLNVFFFNLYLRVLTVKLARLYCIRKLQQISHCAEFSVSMEVAISDSIYRLINIVAFELTRLSRLI